MGLTQRRTPDSTATNLLWPLPIGLPSLVQAAHRRVPPRESGHYRFPPTTSSLLVLYANSCTAVQLIQKQTARRVMPRHDRARSVHSTSPDHPRHSRRNSDVYGRGPSIPQARYTTGSMSSFNAPDQPPITFNLGNQDQTGIPIIDILNKTEGFARLQDRTEAFDMGKKTFTLRVLVSSLDLIGDFLCG